MGERNIGQEIVEGLRDFNDHLKSGRPIEEKYRVTKVSKCRRCDGCGQIANSDDGEPWTYWEQLPPGSDLAVVMGLVQPVSCPTCGGNGYEQATSKPTP